MAATSYDTTVQWHDMLSKVPFIGGPYLIIIISAWHIQKVEYSKLATASK